MPVVLDTATVSLLRSPSAPEADRVLQRLRQLPESDIWTTVISLQEQVKGWLAAINHPRDDRSLLSAYQALLNTLLTFNRFNVWPFDETALAVFHDLRTRGVRIGTRDLRSAAIALSRRATVISQNVRDFQQVPGLKIEDWTV